MAFLIPWSSAPILFACAAHSVFPSFFIGTIAVVALGCKSVIILSKMEAVFGTASYRLTELLLRESVELGVGVDRKNQSTRAKALIQANAWKRKNRGMIEEDTIKFCKHTIENSQFSTFYQK
ncbi:MAG: hypothetical protein VX737_07000 [Pseudomonadota bacterium]|nr:hypothetical protein [Pseudomonadota bacterium]